MQVHLNLGQTRWNRESAWYHVVKGTEQASLGNQLLWGIQMDPLEQSHLGRWQHCAEQHQMENNCCMLCIPKAGMQWAALLVYPGQTKMAVQRHLDNHVLLAEYYMQFARKFGDVSHSEWCDWLRQRQVQCHWELEDQEMG